MKYPTISKIYSRNYKVYSVESGLYPRNTKLSIDDYRRLAIKMADYFAVKIPGVLYMPESERDETARYVLSGYHEDDTIYLDPKWGRIKSFLHEFAHHLNEARNGCNVAGHGRQFVVCRNLVFREAKKTCLFNRKIRKR